MGAALTSLITDRRTTAGWLSVELLCAHAPGPQAVEGPVPSPLRKVAAGLSDVVLCLFILTVKACVHISKDYLYMVEASVLYHKKLENRTGENTPFTVLKQ